MAEEKRATAMNERYCEFSVSIHIVTRQEGLKLEILLEGSRK
jgi:hypothetical protein